MNNDNSPLYQGKKPACWLYGIANLMQHRGIHVDSDAIEGYYAEFVSNTGRDATSIPAFGAYSKKHPILGHYSFSYKTLYNEKVPAYKSFGKGNYERILSIANEEGVIVALKTQKTALLPVVEGELQYLKKGFMVGPNAVHEVACTGVKEGMGLIQFENSWLKLPHFEANPMVFKVLSSAIYKITFTEI